MKQREITCCAKPWVADIYDYQGRDFFAGYEMRFDRDLTNEDTIDQFKEWLYIHRKRAVSPGVWES